MLAERLGLTSGALSYHLRQLERYGFIEDDQSRGNRRDRWWKAAHEMTTFATLRDDPDLTDEADSMTEQLAARSIERLASAARAQRHWPTEWREAFDVSDLVLDLTAAEARQLSEELSHLVERYRRHDPAAELEPGRLPYLLQYQGFLLDGQDW